MTMQIEIESGHLGNAHESLPMYDAGYDEDGGRRILKPGHQWMVIVTDAQGWSYAYTKPEWKFKPMWEWDEEANKGCRGTNYGNWAYSESDLSLKAEAEAEVARLVEQGTVDLTSEWIRMPYPKYGSPAWEIEDRQRALMERMEYA